MQAVHTENCNLQNEENFGNNSNSRCSRKRCHSPFIDLTNKISKSSGSSLDKPLKRASILRAESRKRPEVHAHETALRKRREIKNRNSRLALYTHEDINECVTLVNDCGLMNCYCKDCGAKYFKKEETQRGHFSSCCHSGSVQLDKLKTIPPELLELFIADRRQCINFRQNLRVYNSALAFASFGHNSSSIYPLGKGPKTFVIQGQVYHRTGLCKDGKPKYSELYILDTEEALSHRMGNPCNVNCLPETMHFLDEILRKVNPFASAYFTLSEILKDESQGEAFGRSSVLNVSGVSSGFNESIISESSLLGSGTSGLGGSSGLGSGSIELGGSSGLGSGSIGLGGSSGLGSGSIGLGGSSGLGSGSIGLGGSSGLGSGSSGLGSGSSGLISGSSGMDSGSFGLGGTVGTVRLIITSDRKKDRRRYNAPTANEVAVIFKSSDGTPPFERDICVYPKLGKQKLISISILNPNCDPMTYPILFPFGDSGWEEGLPLFQSKQRKNITMLQFYSYRLQIRNEFNPILNGMKLFQQYVVDAYAKVEANRLQWYRVHQKELRAESYVGLMDFVKNRAETNGLKAGKVIILPSSFLGSPRAMNQNYQDAMAIVSKFGKPDLFVTFTCNPKWTEILENIESWQKPLDRPDIVARVFKMKLQFLLEDILKKDVLGKVVAFIYVIEFQKRGLPHAHMLFILDQMDKAHEPFEIDQIVSAEIPDKNSHPRLYEVVSNNMIHGPFGVFNSKAPCMEKKSDGSNVCSKGFPKEFTHGTNPNCDGYPIYRRRDNGRTICVHNSTVDSRWVVPYNPYLSLKYNAHINVEICSSVKSVKYIFKYVYKGHDAAQVRVSESEASQSPNGNCGLESNGTLSYDEIENFIDSRYVGAPEAIWRLFENKMHDHSHTIIRLAVHCPNMQNVMFESGSEEVALANAVEKKTTLIAWFALNESSSEASKHLYPDIPYFYTFDKEHSKWKPRKQGAEKVISRMYSVNPLDTERYCLRMLLFHVRGAKNFEDLRRVNGILYDTFQDAAKERNLLEDDRQWEKAIEEAVLFKMPQQLRHLFATICIFGMPSNASELWEKYEAYFVEDFSLSNTLENSRSLALNEVENILSSFGKKCTDFRLPQFSKIGFQADIYDTEKELLIAKTLCGTMNTDQLEAYLAIISSVNQNRVSHNMKIFDIDMELQQKNEYNIQCTKIGKGSGDGEASIGGEARGVGKAIIVDGTCEVEETSIFVGASGNGEASDNVPLRLPENCFYLDGPGGSGKTFLYRCLQHKIRGNGGHVICVAPTGIAATLLSGGRTVHSKFKLPLNINENSTANIKPNSIEATNLKNCDLIIWDEISMCHKFMFDCVDRLFKDLLDSKLPFGGKTIVVGGDFRQQLPVVKRSHKQSTLESSVKNSSIWCQFKKIELKTNMRAFGDKEFSDWLISLGDGRLKTYDNFSNCGINIPDDFISNGCLIEEVFGKNISQLTVDELSVRAILCPKNEDSLQMNEEILGKLSGSVESFVSIDKVISDEPEEILRYPLEFLNSLTPTGMPPHKLNIKIGCCVMLLRNLDPKDGLCNGTRMVIKRIQPNVLDCEILSGNFKGKRVFLPRVTLNPSDADLPFTLSRKQFPIRLAYSMTITKSQGQTLENVGIYLPQPVFTHGQLYTAFSRGKAKQNVKIKILETGTQGCCMEIGNLWLTSNVVYKEALM